MTDFNFNSAVQEGIDALVQLEAGKDLLASIIETTAEKSGKSKAEVRKLIAIAYKKQYDPEKYEAEKDLMDFVYSVTDSL
jgi:hypothetical protein